MGNSINGSLVFSGAKGEGEGEEEEVLLSWRPGPGFALDLVLINVDVDELLLSISFVKRGKRKIKEIPARNASGICCY